MYNFKKQKSVLFILISYFLLLISYPNAQTVYEPINNSVYQFLDIMAQKGIIEFHDEIKPVSRKYIAEKLQELSINNEKLTILEKEYLEFYLKDYGVELKFLSSKFKVLGLKNELLNVQDDERRKMDKEQRTNNTSSTIKRQMTSDEQIISNGQFNNSKLFNQPITTIFNWDPYDRWRLFSYSDNIFKLNVSPILGYEAGTRNGAKYSHRWNGLYMYGYLGDNIGYSFRFRDNSENGSTVDRTKGFTPETGVIVVKSNLNNIQYSEVNANISYNWSWGDLSVGKDFLNWGYGQSGLLVLSDKAPSFPFIRLDLHPAKWLRFNYIHAWLASDIIDSSATYYTLLPGRNRTIFRDKYLASHTLTVTPCAGLDISLGESIVYSDNLQIAYLIPIMFFRLADHYIGQRNDGAGSNSQFFLGFSSRNHVKNTHLYGTLFIDELTVEGLFNKQKQRNQFGFTLGGSITDMPFDNLTLTVEFTKIYPFVYSNYIETQTYQSSGYVMGHWMGNNADLIYGALNYRFIRGLQATVWGQYIRKGSKGTVDQQYEQPQPPFLFGLRTNYSYLGAEVKYEITHELFARIKYQQTKISRELTKDNFDDIVTKEFYFSIYYGL